MTLQQLSSLTEDELCALLYVVNVLHPVGPKMEITERLLSAIKHEALKQKVIAAAKQVKPEHMDMYSSMLTKLGIENKVEKK